VLSAPIFPFVLPLAFVSLSHPFLSLPYPSSIPLLLVANEISLGSNSFWNGCTYGRRSWGKFGGLDRLKICRMGQSMFYLPKLSHSFIQNCCWITLQVSLSWRMKDLCQKWKVKLIFRGAWNSLMAWPDWSRPPLFNDRSTPLALRAFYWASYHCKMVRHSSATAYITSEFFRR